MQRGKKNNRKRQTTKMEKMRVSEKSLIKGKRAAVKPIPKCNFKYFNCSVHSDAYRRMCMCV